MSQWPFPREVEKEYHGRTGIFPIMHLIVIKRDILRAETASDSLYKAFEEAKAICIHEASAQSADLLNMLPWLIPELEETKRIMGEDFWPYGLERNRKTLVGGAYNAEQGLVENPFKVEEFFAPETMPRRYRGRRVTRAGF